MVHVVPADTLHKLFIFIFCIFRPVQKGCVGCFDSYVATARYVCLRFISKAAMFRRLKNWGRLFEAGLAVTLC
jgi:hypothetical protein